MESRRKTQATRGRLTAAFTIVLVLLLANASAPPAASAGQAQRANTTSNSSVAVQNTAPSAASSPSGSVHAAASSGAIGTPADKQARAALAPVVYNDDETPGVKGYRYSFFGNAFFINDEGFLLTVAHVLDTFNSGGQPYILLNRANAPPHLVKVEVVAKDAQHDVAILRATPNPFASSYSVAFVSLSPGQAVRGEAVLALSLHPNQAQNAHTFELQREDFSPGTVIALESTQLAKSAPPADVFLLSHPVVKGQSGSPVLDADTHAALGLIEGIWLRGTSASIHITSAQSPDVPGAAIPVRYAIALLQQNGVTWHSAGTKE